jgi:hypothetical protein
MSKRRARAQPVVQTTDQPAESAGLSSAASQNDDP